MIIELENPWELLAQNTLQFNLTVEQIEQLAAYNPPVDGLREKLQGMLKYIDERNRQNWCFITQGNPYNERNENGVNIGQYLTDNSELESNNTFIEYKKETIGYFTRPRKNGVVTDRDSWEVYQIGESKNLKIGTVIDHHNKNYTVKNKDKPAVVRATLDNAIMTCFLRGTTIEIKRFST